MNNMNSNYQNPEMQKDSAGCMGLVVSFFIPIVGIILYFVKRSPMFDARGYLYAAAAGFALNLIVQSCIICIDVLVALMRPGKALNAPQKGIRKSIYACFSPRENILSHTKNLRHFADTKRRRFFSESLQHYLAGKSNCSSFNAPHSSSWATYWMKCAVCL